MNVFERSLWSISLHQDSNASMDDRVYNNGRRGGAVGESNDTGWLYELQLAQALPIVDISRTPLSVILPHWAYRLAVRRMHQVKPTLVWVNRVSVAMICCILFLSADTVRPWIPLASAVFLIPSLCFILFLSVEVLALLQRNYEYWFISILSAINWIGLGCIFGDSRAVACFILWLSSQIVVSIDANYRTYRSAVRSTVVLGPLLVMTVVCCENRLIPDSNFPKLLIGSLTIQSRQAVIFTASTLVIFMFKKTYLRIYRQRAQARNQVDRDSSGDRHVISCIVLHARMRLVPVISKQRLRLGNFNRNQAATASCTQQLRLAHHGSIILDARCMLLSGKQLEFFVSPRMQVLLRLIASIGLASTATAWILLFCHAKKYILILGSIAAASSVVCVLSVAALAQRDLLRLLFWNFDVLFSAFQATTLAICLMDLLMWDTPLNLAVVAWWIWYHWILILDALTPSVTQQLRLRRFALPVSLVLLSIAAVCAGEIVAGDGEIFTSRLLLTVHLPKLGAFEQHTSSLAVQRIITIIGWNARLVLELALCDPAQLLFIKRSIEYTSPFPTFAESMNSEQSPQARTGGRCWRRRPIDVAPANVVHSNLVPHGGRSMTPNGRE